jgi:dolichol-phosphate mannosyltransferase
MERHSILIFTPTYNERDNVPKLHKAVRALPLQTDLLFIDDNSPDGTGEVVMNLQKEDAHVFYIYRSKKLGLGTAHKRAFEYAAQHNYTYVVSLDADLTHDPAYIPAMIQKLTDHDIVIGSRYADGGKMHGWNKVRLPFTYFWRGMIKYGLGLPYDCTGAFRAYRATILKPEIYNQVRGTGFAFCMESLFFFKRAGARIAEIPIQAHSRIHGESKLSAKIMFEVLKTYLRLAWIRLTTGSKEKK